MANSAVTPDRCERATVEEAKEKLLTNEFILRGKEGAPVWNKFDEVIDAVTLQPQGYVRCRFCSNFMRYDSHRTGTSHLNRHKCGSRQSNRISKEKSSSKLLSISSADSSTPSPQVGRLLSVTQTNITANSKVQQDLLDKCVTLCCKDMRPFDLFSGDGFRDMAQCLVNIGATMGKVDVSALLPQPALLGVRTLDIVTEIKAHILPELDEAVSDYGAGITIDTWTDEDRNFLTTTIFYVHRDWKLVKRVLSTSQYDSISGNNTETFKNLLIGNLYGFGLEPGTICNLVYVTPPDLPITSALSTFRRLDCISAVINKVLDITFNIDYLRKHSPDVAKVLLGSTVIVTCLKQSGLVQDIPSAFVKKEGHIPWTVKLEQLMYVREHYDLINQTVFPQDETEHLWSSIHLDILIFLIDFLQPFKQTVEDLEDFHYPTINLVLPWYCKLLKHTQPSINDTCLVASIKSRSHRAIRDNFSIHILHKAATFLWPEFKCLKMISNSEQIEVHNAVRQMLAQDKNEISVLNENHNPNSEQPEKKPKISFPEWEDKRNEADEVSCYISLETTMSDERDLLSWWSCKMKLFPGLSKIARSILAIPASSCSIDSTTSISKRSFHDRRSTINPDTIDGVLFLHSNLG